MIAIALSGTAEAQDTVDGDVRMDNYFYPSWWPKELNLGHYGTGAYTGPSGGGEFGILYTSTDTITIYGLAACISDLSHNYRCLDPSYTNAFEYLRVYEKVHVVTFDTLRAIAQAKMHLHTTPIAYYARHALNNMKIYPMYECYFQSPVAVADSFYLGMTQYIERNCYYHQFSAEYDFACPPLGLYCVGDGPPANLKEISLWNYCISGQHVWGTGIHDSYPLLFPILTPPPSLGQDTTFLGGDTIMAGDTVILSDTTVVSDTLVINGDTIINYDTIVTYDTILGIDDHGLLGRLTGVMPNPAAETAKVVSSFGMSRVEAYNMAGERVADIKVPEGSLSTTLDVRRWPQGAYILHIHTPQGVATKKLAVKR